MRLLLWLKWKLILRGYQRNASLVVSAIIMLLILVLLALPMGLLCGAGFLKFGPINAAHLLKAVLLGIYALWLLSPLLGYALNDTYDISKLFVYPLSVKQIFLGTVVGSLLDITTLLMLPTLFAALFGFTQGLLYLMPDMGALLMNIVALALFVFHTLSLSQAIILLSAGFLRSRRFRDSLGIIFVVIGALFFIVQMTVIQNAKHLNLAGLLASPVWDKINYLPPGLTARALEAAKAGRTTDAISYIFLLAIITGVTLYLAATVVQKVYTGSGESEGSSAPVVRTAGRGVTRRSVWDRLERFLPPAVIAIMEKETKYLFRDPYFRMILTNFAYLTVVTIFMNVMLKNTLRPASENLPYKVSTPQMGPFNNGLILFMQLSLICNFFGTEGGAVTQLFLAPCSRRQILLGKNLSLFLSLSVINLIYVTIATVVSGDYRTLVQSYGLLEVLLMLFMGLGNFASIYAPFRLVMKGWRVKQQSASRGCSYMVLYFLVLLIAFALAIPVLAGFFLPGLLIESQWLALTLPLSVLYAFGLYAASLYIAPGLLERREEQINMKVSMDEA